MRRSLRPLRESEGYCLQQILPKHPLLSLTLTTLSIQAVGGLPLATHFMESNTSVRNGSVKQALSNALVELDGHDPATITHSLLPRDAKVLSPLGLTGIGCLWI